MEGMLLKNQNYIIDNKKATIITYDITMRKLLSKIIGECCSRVLLFALFPHYPKFSSSSESLVVQNMTVFINEAFKEVIKFKWGLLGRP